ncbi:MAG: serine--tRNA ligase [Candidatus Improbicoccus devescovinae]|nr:MAG: serine--tRNA ligase [Candidatus Improbicoccus devescovinae]
MIDIKFLKENVEYAKKIFEKRGCNVNIEKFLELHFEVNKLKNELDNLKSEQKRASSREKAMELKSKINDLKPEFTKIKEERDKIWLILPNDLAKDTPDGKDDSENLEIKRVGEFKKFDFAPLPHEVLGQKLGILDLERGSKVAGSGFCYFVGAGADLAIAVYLLARDVLKRKKFKFLIPPVLANHRTFMGTGYFPFEPEGNYKIENENLYAIGTSEQTLLAFHDNEILNSQDLPLLYSAVTPCFRTEVGSYGKSSRGAFRVHQFNKMEQIVFCRPEESEYFHELCLKNIEELMELLEIPYRIVRVCVGDMGAPGYKKYDVEGWFPSFNDFRETHSNTNLTDFQTRRLNIRTEINKTKIFPHTISSTEITDRAVLAIMENCQQSDGSIKIPTALRKYMYDLEVIKN